MADVVYVDGPLTDTYVRCGGRTQDGDWTPLRVDAEGRVVLSDEDVERITRRVVALLKEGG